MAVFFLVSILATVAIGLGVFMLLQHKVFDESLKLDDAKGYYLVICILIGFVACAGSLYTGQMLGFDLQEANSLLLSLVLLMDVMAALMVLIYGLMKFRQPEHY